MIQCIQNDILCATLKKRISRRYVWGAACGILAAFCYGMNPLGGKPLYRDGFATETVLLLRFGFAVATLAGVMLALRLPFRVTRRTGVVTAILGAVFAVASLTFYASFRVMDVGVTCTMLFVYPVMTAAIMIAFFGERLRWQTVFSAVAAIGGVAFLSLGGHEHTVTCTGVVMILVSAFFYAVYIVIINRARLRMPVTTMTFWVLVSCELCLAAWTALARGAAAFVMPHTVSQWLNALFIAVVPTLLSLAFTAISARRIGSTPTAILGAVEPLTAVGVGVFVFGEAFTLRLAVGIVCILAAVIVILVPAKR